MSPSDGSRFSRRASLVALAGACVPVRGAPAHPVTLLTAELAPFATQEDRRGPGVLVELAQAIAARAKLPLQVVFVPWARAQLDARTQARTLVLPLTRTPDREADYTWLARLSWHRFGFQNLKPQPNLVSIQQAKSKRIGVFRGSPQQQQLEDLGFDAKGLVLATTKADLHRMLHQGMVDAICGSVEINLYSAKQSGYDASRYQLGASLGGGEIWLAAAPLSGFSGAELQRLRRAAHQLEAEGAPQRLFKKYGLEAPTGP